MRGTTALLAAALAAASCASKGENACVDAPTPRAPTAHEDVGRLVGDLLSTDPRESRAAERTLVALDAPGRAALERHARTIPTERDPRWFHVLERNGAFGSATADDRLDLLLWRAARADDREEVAAAEAALAEEARRRPEAFLDRIAGPGGRRAALAKALGEARLRDAVPALLALYRSAESPAERRAASAALGAVAGDSLRPRAEGTPEEREEDAARIEEWHAKGEGRRDD
jgi:hypothetical protein